MADALRYHAVKKIADGGSAEVFLGEQQGAAGFKRPVVIKRIRPSCTPTRSTARCSSKKRGSR